MRIDNYLDLGKAPGISGLMSAIGSFGEIDGNVEFLKKEENGKTVFEYKNGEIRLVSEFSYEENGVVVRRDSFENISSEDIEIKSLSSRFVLDGSEYEVYTQYNGWQHESSGSWQKLVTEIRAASEGIRTCDGATPIMAVHNLLTGKNMVFHLIPNAKWQMSIKKVHSSIKEIVVLESGFCDKALSLKVHPGEVIELPTLIFFSAENKSDLDAYRLHEYYNKAYPRKALPIIYNSWMYCFDKLDIDELKKQTACAADMGFEAFVVDAGWFDGGEDWFLGVGDFEENMHAGPSGRLSELSDFVREKGMIFGLWFEPERAGVNSKSFKNHHEYYITGGFLDFSNPDAVEYILDLISKRIDKYGIGFLKFDFNDSIPNDKSGNAFYRYMQGQKSFISKLRERYPDLYITNCAGGGYRAELGQGAFFDSFWLSDNQGPYEGIRIVKDTLKRMPTSLIERWNVQKYCEGFPTYNNSKTGKMIHCNDATWSFLIGIDDSFSDAFMHGGPMGFSCDIAAFPEEYKKHWTDVISNYKREREFYKNAVARILVDSDSVIIIEYSDSKFDRCVVQIYTKTTHSKSLIIYPVIEKGKEYLYEGKTVLSNDILENGILIENLNQNSCRTLEFVKK